MNKDPEGENLNDTIWIPRSHFNQASFARTIRNYKILQAKFIAILSTIIGLAYFLLGLNWLFSLFIARTPTPSWLLLTGLVLPAFCWPLLIAAGSVVFSCLFAPRCPHCGRRLRQPAVQLASGFCLHCRKELFVNLSLYGFQLKPHNPFYNFQVFHSYVFQGYAIFILLGYIAIFCFLEPIAFAGVLILEGVLSVLLPLLLHIRWSRRKKHHAHGSCKVCGEYPHLMIFTYTGNCSECGSPSTADWPPPEPENAGELPAWDEIAKESGKYRKTIFAVLSFAALLPLAGLIILIGELLPSLHGWVLLTSGLAAAGAFVFALPAWLRVRAISGRKDQSLVFFQCPYCNEYFHENENIKSKPVPHSIHYHCLKHYGRCSLCCRTLVKRTPAGTSEAA